MRCTVVLYPEEGTMRKVLGIATALALLMVFATPVNAIHHDERCETIQAQAAGTKTAKVCVNVNTNDISFGDLVEAYGEFKYANHTGTRVQFDWVHLYKEGEGAVRVTGGPSGWLEIGDSYSTNWYDTAIEGRGNFYAIARWRAKWPNGTTSGYETTRSVGWTHV
jgi:hypothetical protein